MIMSGRKRKYKTTLRGCRNALKGVGNNDLIDKESYDPQRNLRNHRERRWFQHLEPRL